MENGLYIVATPIGNMDDITYRAQKTLMGVNFIICENPKHSIKLLSKLGIKKKLYSIHDHNEDKIIKKIEKIVSKTSIALISDAGSPLISDPGFKLVRFYNKNKLPITVIPGPSSIIAALQLSSMALNEFQFLGYAPKTEVLLENFINELSDHNKTSIFFVSSHRIITFLEMAEKLIMKKKFFVCKELTKLNEKKFSGCAKDILVKLCEDPKNLKGEFVFIAEGKKNKEKYKIPNKDLDEQIIKLLRKFSLTDVVEIVHKISNVSKKQIYNRALDLKK